MSQHCLLWQSFCHLSHYIRLWAQNLNVLLLCNPVTTQWCSIRGQMSNNVSKRTKLLWQDCTALSTLRFCAQSLLFHHQSTTGRFTDDNTSMFLIWNLSADNWLDMAFVNQLLLKSVEECKSFLDSGKMIFTNLLYHCHQRTQQTHPT